MVAPDRMTLKVAKSNLIAAGWSDADVSALVQLIKADAWDKGADHARRAEIAGKGTTQTLYVFSENPYRSQAGAK